LKYLNYYLIALKVLLVPVLLGAVTLAGRRWGQSVAGWLGSFPIVAGPILLILTFENGNSFGARAAQMSLAGIAAAMLFYVVYARLAMHLNWLVTLITALAAWLIAVLALQVLPQTLGVSAILALLTLIFGPFCMAMPNKIDLKITPHPLELPARMIMGALVTLCTSALGTTQGADIAGYAALFPSVGAVLATFSHRGSGGENSARVLLLGMTQGMWSVGSFCLALTLLLPTWPLWGAALSATSAAILTHSITDPRRRAIPPLQAIRK